MTVIGIIPLYDEERDSYWMIPGYMKMLEAQGAVSLMLPLTDDTEKLDYFFSICDGFVLTGGQDVSPEMYHAPKSPACGVPCPLRDRMEDYILRQSVKQDKRILGICRGIQFMNVCFGGTLYQHLPSEYESKVEHHMEPPYDRAVHFVSIHEGTPLFQIIGKEKIGVNSYHHQAIKRMASVYQEMAVSEDGLTEAIYLPDNTFIVGVQWHPELSYQTDENSEKLVQAFVKACAGK